MFYSQNNIDRSDHLRKDAGAIKRLRYQKNARLIPVCDGLSLTAVDISAPAALMLQPQPMMDCTEIFLGIDDSYSYFAVDISTLDGYMRDKLIAEATDRDGNKQTGLFQDLRQSGPLLAPYDGSLLAYARALVYWNANTRFCSACGSALRSSNGGHVRNCTQCSHVVFPRTDPAVIMLVTYASENQSELCLLGRSPGWPEGVFSTLAGFVEPGESLEMAVQREVLEEASIHTENVQYVASQPWPFPRSIMLGFEAQATTTDIQCDPTELADAQWFTREQMRKFGNWGDDGDGNKLPRSDSIARHLIDRWIEADE